MDDGLNTFAATYQRKEYKEKEKKNTKEYKNHCLNGSYESRIIPTYANSQLSLRHSKGWVTFCDFIDIISKFSSSDFQNVKIQIYHYQSTDLKKRKKKDKNGDSSQPIPKSIALLYKEIEKNGWIELTCKCPRKGPTKKDSQSQSSQSSTGSMTNRLENAHIAAGQSPLKPKSRWF